MKETTFKSFDGTELFLRVWDEVEKPVGVVQISHGMCEHSGRYDELAKYLNSRGYVCFADDHRGHGQSETDKSRGWHKGNIFRDTVADLVCLNRHFQNEYQLPLFYIGHSYGSLLGQAFLEQPQASVTAAVLIGATMYRGGAMFAGAVTTFPLRRVLGKVKIVVSDNVFGKYVTNGERPTEHGIWLTRDETRRKEIYDDPYRAKAMTLNFFHSLSRGIYSMYRSESLDRLNPDTAIMLLSGDTDTLSRGGRKLHPLFASFKAHGVKNVGLKLYENARHSLLEDLCRDEVMHDIADYLDNCRQAVRAKSEQGAEQSAQ